MGGWFCIVAMGNTVGAQTLVRYKEVSAIGNVRYYPVRVCAAGLSLVHNMTQVVARPRDAMRRHAKICQHSEVVTKIRDGTGQSRD